MEGEAVGVTTSQESGLIPGNEQRPSREEMLGSKLGGQGVIVEGQNSYPGNTHAQRHACTKACTLSGMCSHV